MNQKNLKAVIFIFLLALTVGLGYLKFGVVSPVGGDTISHYDPIALNLTSGNGFAKDGTPTAEVFPGYPLFLAIIYGLFGHNYDAVRIIQVFLLAGIGVIIYFIARKHLKLSLPISFLSSLTTVLWPYLILYSTLILTEILFIFLFLLSIYFLMNFWQEQTYQVGITSGIILGLAMLTRLTILLLPIWLCIFLFITLKLQKKEYQWKKVVVLLLLTMTVMSPWIIRNFIQFNSFVLMSEPLDLTQVKGEPLQPNEINLKTVILTKLKNIYLFWDPGASGSRVQALTEKYPWANNLVLVYKVLFFLILGIAFLSLKFIKRGEIFVLWAVILYFWAVHSILFPYPRYLLPVMPLIILLAFYTVAKSKIFFARFSQV